MALDSPVWFEVAQRALDDACYVLHMTSRGGYVPPQPLTDVEVGELSRAQLEVSRALGAQIKLRAELEADSLTQARADRDALARAMADRYDCGLDITAATLAPHLGVHRTTVRAMLRRTGYPNADKFGPAPQLTPGDIRRLQHVREDVERAIERAGGRAEDEQRQLAEADAAVRAAERARNELVRTIRRRRPDRAYGVVRDIAAALELHRTVVYGILKADPRRPGLEA